MADEDIPVDYLFVQDNRSLNCMITVNETDAESNIVDEDNYLYILHIILCVLSILVSLLNIFIFTRPALRSSSINLLLLAIELSNLIVSVHYLPICVMKYAFPLTFYFKGDVPQAQTYIEIVMQSSVGFTVWMTTLVAVWRCVAVVWPLRARTLLTPNKARALMVGLACFSVLFITSVYLITLHVYKVPFSICVRTENGTVIANLNVYFLSVLHIIQACWLSLLLCLVFFLIPTVFSIVSTIWMIWTIKISLKIRKTMHGATNRDKSDTSACIRTTIVLTLTLFAFSITNFTPYLTAMLTVSKNNYTPLPHPLDYIFDEYLLGIVVNCFSTVGFYFIGTTFRETLVDYFVCWKKKRGNPKNDETGTNVTVLYGSQDISLTE